MHPKTTFRNGLALTGLLLVLPHLAADVVETKNGAHLVGRITKIDAGSVVLDTDYAGTITIKQDAVTSLTTDSPVAVRLQSGTRVDGRVTTGADGELRIAGAEGTLTTPVSKVAASWAAGGKDPAVAALERHWAYEASVDLTGKTGNSEQLGTSGAFRATLKTNSDTLQFYTNYDRQVSDHAKSADQFKAGVDYQDNFEGRVSWYVRDEGGFDRVKDMQFYDIAAAGLGYDFIKRPKHTLTGRFGLSFRDEDYKNPATSDVQSAGLDLGLSHVYQLANSKIENRLSILPAFENFSNVRITHESSYEIPLAAPAWKLRLGVSNDFNSKPGAGVEKLDTTYFTRLILNWQ